MIIYKAFQIGLQSSFSRLVLVIDALHLERILLFTLWDQLILS